MRYFLYLNIVSLAGVILCCGGSFVPVQAAVLEGRLDVGSIAKAQPAEDDVRWLLPDAEAVDHRLNYYRDRLAGWNQLLAAQITSDTATRERMAACQASAAKAAAGYETLKKTVSAGALKEGEPRPWDVAFADIHYLATGCDTVFEQVRKQLDKTKLPGQDTAVKQAEVTMPVLFLEEKYLDVIAAFEKGRAEDARWQPASIIRKQYGISLMRLGRFSDAAQILREAIPLETDDAGKLSATRLVADLYLAAGNVREAQGHYQKLAEGLGSQGGERGWIVELLGLLATTDLKSEEFAAFQRVVKASFAFKGKWMPPELTRSASMFVDSFPGSVFLSRVQAILDEVKGQSQKWLDSQSAQLETLLADKQFKPAKDLIDQVLSGHLSSEQREALLTTKEEVLLAETKEMEYQKQALEQKQSIEWTEAVNLLDSRKYDEAIAAFGTFVGTSYEEEARGKIDLAANQAANDNRRQAANLFVKARKAQDQKYKQELLVESRQLLVDILQKYSQTEIIDKVKQNLKIIEEQIRNLDPASIKQDSGNQNASPGT